ncbi:hypothetical protein BC940DRAFT_367590 [Gongronella butleri]|nr:hypothetical protein BC940DRAFT_367590 [Gongronella butleri]
MLSRYDFSFIAFVSTYLVFFLFTRHDSKPLRPSYQRLPVVVAPLDDTSPSSTSLSSSPASSLPFSSPSDTWTHPLAETNASISLPRAVSTQDWLCDCCGKDDTLAHKVDDAPVAAPAWLEDGDAQPMMELSMQQPLWVNRDRLGKKAIVDVIEGNLQWPRTGIMTVATSGMRVDVLNWIESLKRTGEDKVVVACLDALLYADLQSVGFTSHAFLVPSTWMHYSQLDSPEMAAFASTVIVHQLLHLDISVLYASPEIVWLRERAREHTCALIDVRWDRTHAVFQQDSIDHHAVSNALFLMRPTPTMRSYLARTIDLQERALKSPRMPVTHKQALNQALAHLDLQMRTSQIVLLNVVHFPNKAVYFDSRLPAQLGIAPYLVHANQLSAHPFQTQS